MRTLRITTSKENYLKAIAEAEAEGETVIAATLTRWLGVSAPAVTMAIRRLKRDGLILVGAEGRLSLTQAGQEIADRLLRRHYLIERMLAEVFGMEWYMVHEEAEQLEHAVSADFERKLEEKLGSDSEWRQGNWLETQTHRRERGLIPLVELSEGETARVVSVFDRDRHILESLDGQGIRPGATLQLMRKGNSDAATLLVEQREVPVSPSAAGKVWVRKVYV